MLQQTSVLAKLHLLIHQQIMDAIVLPQEVFQMLQLVHANLHLSLIMVFVSVREINFMMPTLLQNVVAMLHSKEIAQHRIAFVIHQQVFLS